MAALPSFADPAAARPKSVQVNKTAGTTVEIAWADGHQSAYKFQYLRDACPCATCDEERGQPGQERQPWESPRPKPGALPMFKQPVRPNHVRSIGRYAIAFDWSDGHHHGIYSWEFLRTICPCPACAAARAAK